MADESTTPKPIDASSVELEVSWDVYLPIACRVEYLGVVFAPVCLTRGEAGKAHFAIEVARRQFMMLLKDEEPVVSLASA